MTSTGDMAGSVSGGCVENDVFLRLQSVLQGGRPELVGYGIADEEAFAVGLACGGRIEVYLEDQTENAILDAAEALVAREATGTVAMVVGGPAQGKAALIEDAGVRVGELPEAIMADVLADSTALLDRGEALTLQYGEHEVYLESVSPPTRLVIFGAVHIGQELARLAHQLGYHVTVSDARQAFLTDERFPSADRLAVGWPDQVDINFDRNTAVVVLSHDARFEDPLWPRLLRSAVPYIGAMGSSGTAARRRQKLEAQGFGPEDIARIHGPVGLDIGASTPAEVAVAIMGEIIAVRRTGELALRGVARRLPSN
jgi:xanthine dehydrogenase accessory factor